MKTLFFVGLGGAVGAILRYAISSIPYKGVFPLITLIINVCGAFVIGCIAGFAEGKGMSANMILFAKVGVCGGFTTFSTFSLEAYKLIEGKLYGHAITYIALSAVLSILATALGMLLVKRITLQ